MGYAQNLIDEIEYKIEIEVEEELHNAIEQEFEGNLSSECAQALIDSTE